MQRWDFGPHDSMMVPLADGRFYVAADVDARIAEGNAAQLRLCEEAQIAAGTIAQQGQRIRELEMALGNCRLLAMKRLHKGSTEIPDWEAILRFCTDAGCGPSPLR